MATGLTTARLLLLLLVIAAGAFACSHRSAWVEVGERDFERRVLQAQRPALVYFDAAAGLQGGDRVFKTLSEQRRGVLDVFYVNSTAHPQLARAYGVETDVVFALFERGRVVKRAQAAILLAVATANNNDVYSDEKFLAEIEAFANLR